MPIRRRLPLAALACAGAIAAVPSAAGAASSGGYIVQLKAPPAASYDGGTQGIPATSPRATGARSFDRTSSANARYRSYLDGRQDAALDRAPGTPQVTDEYRTAFAGFAAKLTERQLAALRKAPEVAHVFPNTISHPLVVDPANPSQVDAALGGSHGDGPGYLGLPGGLWNSFGGADHAGDGVIVGVIDTGITPEHPSFADDPSGNKYVGSPYGAPPSSWHGICQAGEGWTAADCNDKLIGARYYTDGAGPDEQLSAIDEEGHGTHTASTAAGNFGVNPSYLGNSLGVDLESGMAPRARVAAYKVCWAGGCASTDTVKAIDDAVADGVDVINYSLGSTGTTVVSADSVAMLGASDAGVFISASAGNDGPDPDTIGDPSGAPWVTGVGASTLARDFQSTITVTGAPGGTFTVTGSSATPARASSAIVDASTAGKAGVDAADAKLCLDGTLDPAKVTGKVVLCTRGGPSRVATSSEVKDAGGVGEILVNAKDPQDLAAYPFFLPTVTVSAADGARIATAAAATTATRVAFSAGSAVAQPRGGVLAAFSSRGPQSGSPDIAKPDITAPGVSILAGNTPRPLASEKLSPPNELYQVISGTSMSAPHVAGAAALLTQAHPTYSPAAIKSSLMTTADPDVLREDGATAADAFDTGSGEIDPNKAVDPGLVVDASTGDYLAYIAGADPAAGVDDVTPIDAPQLNLPSISASQVPGSITVTRRFTGVLPTPADWSASVTGVPGFDVALSTSTLSVPAGATRSLSLTFTRTDAPVDTYSFGTLRLTSGSRVVRIPISLRPVAVKAPDTTTISTDQASGSRDLTVRTGFAGQLFGRGYGFAAPTVKSGETVQTAGNGGVPVLTGDDPGTKLYPITVGADAKLLDARISNADGGARPATDLDLYLARDANGDGKFTSDEIVDQSATASADEGLQLLLPEPGNYALAVVGFATAQPSTFDLSTWLVDDATADDATPSPSLAVSGDPLSAAIGKDATLRVDWAGVQAKGRYLGIAALGSSNDGAVADADALTVVELDKTVDTAAPADTTTPTTTPPAASTPPAAAPPASPPAAAPAPKLRVVASNIRGRVLTFVVELRESGNLRATIRKGRTVYAKAKARRVLGGKRRTVRMLLDKRPRKGTYTVYLTYGSGAGAVSKASRLRLRS